jgi:predicted dehydrogenase
MSTWRVVHVGCGKRGRSWVQEIQQRDPFQSVALVDPSEEALASTREQFPELEAPAFGDVAEALQEVEADIAIVAAAASSRQHDCVTAAAAGLHMLVEKPLALTLEEGNAIAAAARENGVHAVAGQNYRYAPPNLALSRHLQQGTIGTPGLCVFTRSRRRRGEGTYQQHMRHNYLWEMGVHDLDLIRFVLHRKPLTVAGVSWLPPWGDFTGETTVQALIRFEGDVVVNYFGAWASAMGEQKFRVDGSLGAVQLEQGDVVFTAYEDGEKRTLAKPVTSGGAGLLEELIESIETGAAPATSAADNLWTLGLLDAIQRSSGQGNAPVEVRAGEEAPLSK